MQMAAGDWLLLAARAGGLRQGETVATPKEKGDSLEAAVSTIETHILSTTPALREKTFLIESKKIIDVGGVHHEIDIFVTIDLDNGYKSIFIFECKNWRKPVGKNEVIVLSEKIDACQAQRGFLVSKSFTKDARSQAEKDPRVTLATVAEHDPLATEIPFGFHFVFSTVDHVEISFQSRGHEGERVTLDMSTARAQFLGETIDLRQYVLSWGSQRTDEDARSFRSELFPEGLYERTAHANREFTIGEFILDDQDIERAELSVSYTLRVARPPIISHYEIAARGRVMTLAPVQYQGPVTLQVKLISK
jgi:hypothetical protein